MTKRLAIDPGDVHVGWAYDGSSTVQAGEWTPTEAVDELVRMMTHDAVDELIIEEFVLYEWEAKKQAWSEMKTSQLIGALKLIAYWFRIPVFMQPATIKKPTRGKLRAKGVKMAQGSIHANDAQLHLWHRRLQERSRRRHELGAADPDPHTDRRRDGVG